MMALLAHGIGAIKDLPVPAWLFLYGAAVVLVVSFAALTALWKEPRLEPAAAGRPLPPRLQGPLLAAPLRAFLGALSLALLGIVFVAALIGDDSVAANIAPTFVWVVFWLGLVPLVVVFGNVWAVLNPWRAAADGLAWLRSRVGSPPDPPFRYPDWLGRWPAAVLLFAFASFELAYTEPSNPRALAIAILVYSWVTWLAMAAFGRDTWLENGEAFHVYFGLLARLSPFGARETEDGRELYVRPPLAGLAAPDGRPGTLAFIAVMLGSVAFDGLSRISWWVDRQYSVATALADRPGLADLAGIGLNVLGLVACVVFVATAYLAAVRAAEAVVGRRPPLTQAFLMSLVPIALVYAVAHYFSLFVLQGQFAIRLVSDPFGYGWDIFGTADYVPDLNVLAPNTVWYVQVAALVAGHVLGLVLAHDRAVTMFASVSTAARTQYAMLALMIVYTVGGMWLLSND